MTMKKTLTFTERECDLITTALYLLADQGKELHFDLADDLGGIPDGDEVWKLKEKVQE